MRFLPWLVMGASVALAVTAEGCADRACLEWNQQAEGACPRQADARAFFGDCSDIKHVDSQPTYLSDLGGLCCYDVTHVPPGKTIACQGSTTTTHPTPTSTTTTGTGGSGPTSTSTSGGTTGTSTGGGGSSPSCQTCSDAMMNGNTGDICAGGSSTAFVDLVTCACTGATCGATCDTFCSLGAAPTGACFNCFDAMCSAEAAACDSE